MRRKRNAARQDDPNSNSNAVASTSTQNDHTANKNRTKPKNVSAGGGQLSRLKGQEEIKSSPKRMRSIETTPSTQPHESKRRDNKNTPQSNEDNMSLDDKETGHTDNLATNESSGVQDSVQEATLLAKIDLTNDATVETEKTEGKTVGNDESSY